MKNLVKQLVGLQEIDSRFNELRLQKGDLPVLIQEIESNLKNSEEELQDLNEKIEKGEADRRMFQLEIEASKGKLAEYENKLYKVQTNKEYDAISLEIDTKKMETNELENKILQSLEEEEELKKSIEEIESSVSEQKQHLKEHQTELKEIIKITEEEEAKLKHEREKIVRDLDKRFYSRYQRISGGRDGLAVVPVKKGSCGGCYSSIPPQKIVEIREMNRIFTCEHCGRILVWDDKLNEI